MDHPVEDAEQTQEQIVRTDGYMSVNSSTSPRPSVWLLAVRSSQPATTQADDRSSHAQRSIDSSADSSSVPSQDPAAETQQQVFFSSAQFTADGTSVVVKASDHTIQTHVLPEDLLQPSSDEPRLLEAQGHIDLPEPTQVVTPAPFYSLVEPSTQTLLVGCRDHPIHLHNAFPNTNASIPLCSYRLVKHETEAYITPSSLLWEAPGTHFFCGSANRLDYFDISRYGSDGPILTIPTIPSKRHISKGHGIGMKGTVSALAASENDTENSLVAAGTRSRWIGLYDVHRTDKTVANWSLFNAEKALDTSESLDGRGIVQLMWSPCGRYLVINERHASGLMVYDVRVTGQLLSLLRGRDTTSQQTLGCSIYRGNSYSVGIEVWGGTDDGSVRVWDNVGMYNGAVEPSWDWQAHDAPIGSTLIHRSGSVAATCAGGWKYSSTPDQDERSMTTARGVEVFEDSSLKVWAIGASG